MDAAILRPLLQGHWYDALAAVLDAEITGGHTAQPAAVRARDLAAAAARILDLDAEDFAAIAGAFPDAGWREGLLAASFPADPRDPVRGALGSLVGLYELMLEVVDLRAARREPLQVVVTAHLIGEYLPQLAWESTLGHGGDPLRLGEDVGERWGSDDPTCAHSGAQRTTARRALNACSGDRAGYRAYLDRFHSRQGSALAVCALHHEATRPGERPDVGETCPLPCAWARRGTREDQRDLDARVRLALIYQESPLVALRHHAPVGHFFGVPSTAEISDAWLATWSRLSAPWPDGENPLVRGVVRGRPEPGEALPGLSTLVSVVAGRPIGPGRLVRAVGDAIAQGKEVA
ncbi:MAG: hypothetical protein Q4F65_02900 [Propionibacteriaceae bacterium]|nr:hypothetical protein [Propionibacteriaceae bacterium]